MDLYCLNDKFNFGKHFGRTIREVINEDIDTSLKAYFGKAFIMNRTYVEWCVQNISGFVLTKDVIAFAEMREPRYNWTSLIEANEKQLELYWKYESTRNQQKKDPHDDGSCGACGMYDCMCSDREHTSTLHDY